MARAAQKEIEMKKLFKNFTAEVKEFNDVELSITHFISTERIDRGGDVMMADGMKTLGRPVVLMAHGYSQMGSEPIAKPVKLWKDSFKGNKGIAAKTKFYDGSHLTPPDSTGRRLYEKAKEGYLVNWSIGYIPLKWNFETLKGVEIRRVTEWDLLEYSPVGVPMNPDCQNTEKCGDCQKKSWFMVVAKEEKDPDCYKSIGEESLWDDDKAAQAARDKAERSKLEEKYGDLCQYKDGALCDMEGKPYPSEHSCRISDPGKYDRFRRQNDKFGKGIDVIWGIKEGNPVELQAIRFAKEKFTADEAKAWCKSHDYKCKPFEPASGKCEDCGGDKVWVWMNFEKEEGEYICRTCLDAKGAIPYHKTPLAPEEDKWDAGSEVKKAEVKDLKIMCAWFADKGENKTDYKLPHHKGDGDHACVWNGVRAAAAVLQGARGGADLGSDKAAVQAHIGKHYGDFDKGDPPWKKGRVVSINDFNEFIKILLREGDDKPTAEEIYESAIEFVPSIAKYFKEEKNESFVVEEFKNFVVKSIETVNDKFKESLENIRSEIELIKNPASIKRVMTIKEDGEKEVISVVVNEPEKVSVDLAQLGKLISETVGATVRSELRKLTGKVD